MTANEAEAFVGDAKCNVSFLQVNKLQGLIVDVVFHLAIIVISDSQHKSSSSRVCLFILKQDEEQPSLTLME